MKKKEMQFKGAVQTKCFVKIDFTLLHCPSFFIDERVFKEVKGYVTAAAFLIDMCH